MSEATHLLEAIQHGNAAAADQLLALVYEELRQLATSKMAKERPGHTLQPTALVHEAWLRLTGQEGLNFENRAHFFAAAAEAMRRILVESARKKRSLKRGGEWERVSLDEVELPLPIADEDLLLLDEVLDRLATVEACAAEVIKLRFFVGLTQEQVARELNLSTSTVERRWIFGRAWLFREMQKARQAVP